MLIRLRRDTHLRYTHVAVYAASVVDVNGMFVRVDEVMWRKLPVFSVVRERFGL